MRIKVNDRTYLRDLILFMRACGCVAEQGSADEVDVFVPDARTDRDARREVDVYLEVWRTKSAGSAEVMEAGAG